MAPPRKLDADLKRPRSVSLSDHQNETFQLMGGSSWLQTILIEERKKIDAGRKALPHFVKVDPSPARRGKKPGHANAEDFGAVTPKTRVLRMHPQARAVRNGFNRLPWQVINPNAAASLGSGTTSREAWANADDKIINSGKAAQKGSK